ncbi:DUF11 domain-containing protein [Prescottella defluvii]|uniref:hypothetical protein n=1 Tax=Prescottella defluvii TaxID=1323361 RepID=UPI0012E06FC2|nr:hypothetical protein [Prescottella defluvii]
MSRTFTRRIAASVAAAAVVAGGIGLGAGTASAAGTGSLGSLGSGSADTAPVSSGVVPQPGVDYPKSATDSSDNVQFTRQVVGDGTVAPDGLVTYRTTFSVTNGLDRFLQTVVDIPAGPEFTYVAGSAKVNGKGVDTTTDAPTGAVTMSSGGWRLSKNTGDTVTFEVTYKAPSNLTVGNVYNSGINFKPTTWQNMQKFPEVGAWVKARASNAGEAVTGSLDSSGFGSSGPVAGGSSGSAIINDPAGFIADIISNVFQNGS